MLRASTHPTHRLHLLLMMLIGLVALTISTGAAAQSRVNVRVDVIVASSAGTGVDASLNAHRGRLEAQFPNFDSFRSQGVQQLRLATGETSSFGIPGGGTVRVTLVSAHEGRATFDVAVPGGSVRVETTHGSLFFVGGPRSPNGTVILMIRAG